MPIFKKGKVFPLSMSGKKLYKTSLFIFRRDLRLNDNTALIEAFKSSEAVIPCFIFDDSQVKDNDYFSINAYSFMIESLEELSAKIKSLGGTLIYLNGKPDEEILKIGQK